MTQADINDNAVGSNVTDLAAAIVGGFQRVTGQAVNAVVPPTFVKMIVLDVISDPFTEVNEKERVDDLMRWNISNVNLLDELPRNTIVAKKIGEDVSPMFVYPFFPSHLSLPCKPGECVWVMIEKPAIRDLEIAYWFSHVVESHFSDDVNHSHPNRSTELSLTPSTVEIHDNEKKGTAASAEDVWHENRNAPTIKAGEGGDERRTSYDNATLIGHDEDIFEVLITETRASKHVSFEAVPRFRKRPGDVVLEGTNNTLIVLGLERSGSIQMPTNQPMSDAGSIDIVVGRGQSEETLGKEAKTTSIKDAKGATKGTELKKELHKAPSALSPQEGDLDMKNDRSRIMVSQRTFVDGNFGLDTYNSSTKMGVTDEKTGEPGIVIKSDKVRLIARSDVEIVVTGFEPKKVSDTKTIKEQKAYADDKGKVNWASITIKSNGDIVFTPSDEGYVRLGGPDANLGILCSDVPVTTANGGVTGPALVTTMGGSVGGSKTSDEGKTNTPFHEKGQGKFANKVLIK